MLRRLVLFLAVLLAGCSASNLASNAAHHPPKKDWTITVTFNYDFTNFVPCSATVTKGCITGLQWGYTQSGGTIPLKTSPPSICTGTTQPEVCTDTTNALLGIGSVTMTCWPGLYSLGGFFAILGAGFYSFTPSDSTTTASMAGFDSI